MASYLICGSVTAVAGYHAYQYAKAYKEELERTIQQIQQQNKEITDKIAFLTKHVKDLETQFKMDVDVKNSSRADFELSDFEVNDSMTSSSTPPFLPEEQEEKIENGDVTAKQNGGVGTKAKSKKEQYVEDCMRVVEGVRREAGELEEGIIGFKGTASDRIYKSYNESLIRFLIRLDVVDPKGDEGLRDAKKEAVKYIQRLQQHLKTM